MGSLPLPYALVFNALQADTEQSAPRSRQLGYEGTGFVQDPAGRQSGGHTGPRPLSIRDEAGGLLRGTALLACGWPFAFELSAGCSVGQRALWAPAPRGLLGSSGVQVFLGEPLGEQLVAAPQGGRCPALRGPPRSTVG